MAAGRREAGRWLDDASGVEYLLWRQHQVISRSQVLALGLRRSVARRIRNGTWQRVHSGIYLAHNGPSTDQQRLWAAILACGPGTYLAGLTDAT